MLRVLTAAGLLALSVGSAQVISSIPALADDGDKLPLFLQRPVDITAQDPSTPGFLWQGAGSPATNFLRKRNLNAGVELAIKAVVRQGPDLPPTYVDSKGIVHVEVPAGPQPGNPARAAWNFTFSYDAALPGASPTLDNYDAELWIDLDPSKRTKYLKLKLARTGTPPCAGPEPDCNGWGWKSGNTFVIPDDEGTQRVTQNSQNYAFYQSLIPNYAPNFGPAEFDVVMKMRKKGGKHHNDDNDDDDNDDDNSTTVHVVFNVVSAPTP
jgi:hypothetical protein